MRRPISQSTDNPADERTDAIADAEPAQEQPRGSRERVR